LLRYHETPAAERVEDLARRNVALLVERNRQDLRIDYTQVGSRQVRSVGIVGMGMMGTVIAATHVKANLPVVVTDADEGLLAGAAERIAAELALMTGLSGPLCAADVRRLVASTSDPAEIGRCDLVLESVVEAPDVKRQIYAWLKPCLSLGTILASNTSTIPIGQLTAGLADPDRFCGLHFFHPVRERSLVEIARGPGTSDETIATAVGHAQAIGKMPIVVGDGPAFVVNRLLHPYLSEALEMLLDGATIDQIERAATDFGMAIGPLRILDEIGVDTVVNAARVLWQAFPERMVASPLLINMFKEKRLGRKSGAGFFSYSSPTAGNGRNRPDPEAERIIAKWARPPKQFTREMITRRLTLPMVLEATRLLEEKKARRPEDIDLAVLFGLGFPASRGGLLYWADTLGADRILRMLKPLESLGHRFRPTRLLLEAARAGRRLYDCNGG